MKGWRHRYNASACKLKAEAAAAPQVFNPATFINQEIKPATFLQRHSLDTSHLMTCAGGGMARPASVTFMGEWSGVVVRGV